AMKSFVTRLSAISVTSIERLPMSVSSRSKGPAKLSSARRKPPGSASAGAGASTSGDGATGDQLARELAVDLGSRVLGGELGHRHPGDGCVGELHRAAHDGLEHGVAEGLHHAVHDLARVQRAGVEHGHQDAV